MYSVVRELGYLLVEVLEYFLAVELECSSVVELECSWEMVLEYFSVVVSGCLLGSVGRFPLGVADP